MHARGSAHAIVVELSWGRDEPGAGTDQRLGVHHRPARSGRLTTRGSGAIESVRSGDVGLPQLLRAVGSNSSIRFAGWVLIRSSTLSLRTFWLNVWYPNPY